MVKSKNYQQTWNLHKFLNTYSQNSESLNYVYVCALLKSRKNRDSNFHPPNKVKPNFTAIITGITLNPSKLGYSGKRNTLPHWKSYSVWVRYWNWSFPIWYLVSYSGVDFSLFFFKIPNEFYLLMYFDFNSKISL